MQKKYKKKEPIKSYGLILFTTESDVGEKPLLNDVESSNRFPVYRFFITQRRDTYEYSDYMVGNWDTLERLTFIISRMTDDEKYRIRNYTFDELWEDMWISKDCNIYVNCYLRVKAKHEEAAEHIASILDSFILNLSESSKIGNKVIPTAVIFPVTITAPWGFPKGRKDTLSEKDWECAIREVEEETHMSRDFYASKVSRGERYCEEYFGSNNKSYYTCYFPCEVSNSIPIVQVPVYGGIRKLSVSDEVFDGKWVTLDEIINENLLSQQRVVMLKKIISMRTKIT